MTTEKKRFTRLADALAGYLKASGLEERFEEAAVVPEWAERVGPAIAAVTTPLSVSHGTLRVGVRSSAWLSELHLVEREIVRRLNAGRARGRINRIRFVQMDPGDPGGRADGEGVGGGRPVRPTTGQRKP
ncbi:MAG: DUF721 domain-containing protein [Gemmatimonadota bacterium]|jgi:predicted nucleic acid-binding Zn ribbon protein